MSLRWDDTKILGIEDIDDQHKEIFTRFELVSNAFQSGRGMEALQELIPFLEEYVQVHFSLEDRYMLKYSYPKIEAQRLEHTELVKDVKAMHECMQQGGASRELAARAFGNMIRWLIHHTSTQDREMTTYIIEQMASENNLRDRNGADIQ